MNKKMMIGLTGLVGFVLAGIAISLYTQPQKVSLRYRLNVDDVWQYECVLESETNSATNSFGDEGEITDSTDNKYLDYIKENFRYKVLEITHENYIKVNLITTPIESKGVNIDIKNKEKENMYDFVGKEDNEEIFINLKGKIYTMTNSAKTAKYMVRKDNVVAGSLGVFYENMIKWFHPVLPDGEVGINDTWNYQIILVPDFGPRMVDFAEQVPTTIVYKIVGFENKDGFDCAKIEYNYKLDLSDKINEELAKEEKTKIYKVELKISGAGTLYFAYNKKFPVYRKENLLKTEIESELVNEKWGIRHSRTERIGFTMNYIKP